MHWPSLPAHHSGLQQLTMDGVCGAIAPATEHTDSRIRTEEQQLALRRTDQPVRLTRGPTATRPGRAM
eukprot:6209858-Prymnesium_polylepis.1